MNGHTPGPWRLRPTDDCEVIDATDAEVACICGDYNEPDLWPLMEANARLIAAAPELLAALVGLLVSDEGLAWCSPGARERQLAARAAIAKAEGRS